MSEESKVKNVISNKGDNPLFSKTLWTGIAAAILPLFPKAMVWWTNNPEIASVGIGALVIIIGLFTKRKITLDMVLDLFKSKK